MFFSFARNHWYHPKSHIMKSVGLFGFDFNFKDKIKNLWVRDHSQITLAYWVSSLVNQMLTYSGAYLGF